MVSLFLALLYVFESLLHLAGSPSSVFRLGSHAVTLLVTMLCFFAKNPTKPLSINYRTVCIGCDVIGRVHWYYDWVDSALLVLRHRFVRFGLSTSASDDSVSYERDFVLNVRSHVGMENIVEPNLGWAVNVRVLPRIPGQKGLRPTRNKAPVERSDSELLGNGKYRLECGSSRSRHVLGANKRPIVSLQLLHTGQIVVRIAVVVERDHVRILHLELLQRSQRIVGLPVALPDARCERLAGIDGASPLEHARQQVGHKLHLVGRLSVTVAAHVHVVRFVPQVPAENSSIVSECANDALDVGFKASQVKIRLLQNAGAWALHPATIVHAWHRIALRTKLWHGIPATVKEHEQDTDPVGLAD